MLELPEVLNVSKQLNESVSGKKVYKVHPPSSLHKFCWYSRDVSEYDELLKNCSFLEAEGFGIYAEMQFSKGMRLCFNDGVNVRLLLPNAPRPKKYQLMIDFDDESSLCFTVAMYGGIICHDGSYDNEYYLKSKESISPLCDEFDYAYFEELISSVKQNLSAKAFLASEQRIPGIGNGVLQDILFNAGINPKRKLNTIENREALFDSIKSTLDEMALKGGRNTEKNIYGNPGGYDTIMCKNTRKCPKCGNEILKETFMGGSVYYCTTCQPIDVL